MRLLTFNHHSIDESSTIDEVNEFFLELSKGIKKYILENGIRNSRFFTELENFIQYEIIVGYKIIDAIKSLSRDLQSIILELITMRCNDDCLNKLSEDDEEKITDYEIIFPDEAYGKDYMVLSFVLEKNGILLSFNRDRWVDTPIEILKYKDEKTTSGSIDNIATEEHATTLLVNEEKVIKDNVIDKLSDKVQYTEAFKEWMQLCKISHIEQTVEKVNFAMEHKLDRRAGAIGKINSLIDNLFEVVVGSPQGMEDAQIRVFFKDFNRITYILYGFIKQNEYGMTYEKAGHIDATLKIIKDEELDEI